MDEYLDRQRRRFELQQSRRDSGTASSGVASAAPVAAALSRLHILPLNREVRERASVWMPRLKNLMNTPLCEGDLLFEDSAVVAKTEPADSSGALLTRDTEIYLDGPVVHVLSRVQLVQLAPASVEREGEGEGSSTSGDEAEVFEQVLGPFLQRRLGAGAACLPRVLLVQSGAVLETHTASPRGTERFHVAATDPSASAASRLGGGGAGGGGQQTALWAIDRNTLVYLTIDRTEEYTRIHVVPYQETLPRAYEFDVFSDYLRPFFQSHQFQRFGLNQLIAYNGVQFRIVAVEPEQPLPGAGAEAVGVGGRRVGARTVIYCEGVLHGNMRHVLPAEVMEQLALLPPGLQLLLLNSDAGLGLSGAGGLDRIAGLEQTLNTRRGLDEETIARLPEVPWTSATRQECCMVCLAEFQNQEAVRQLPCSHVYHAPCIDEWLRRNTDCPLCKANVDRSLRGY